MKIRIEIDDSIQEDEVTIRCASLSDDIREIQKAIESIILQKEPIVFYKNETEYYLPLSSILFFETESNSLIAHTTDGIYQVKYKLYILEKLLPYYFMRVSKSTILNINRIYSITRNITASSVVEFQHTHKKVYVSRSYYKSLKEKLVEKRR